MPVCLVLMGSGLALPAAGASQPHVDAARQSAAAQPPAAAESRGAAEATPLAEPQRDAQTVPLARPMFEASAGYGFLSGGSIVDGHGPGWLFGFGWNAARRLAIVMEAGSNRLRQDVGLLDVTADFHQLMAGARFALTGGRVRPFAQALFGGSRIDYSVSADFPFPSSGIFDETRWAWQVGGGLDVAMAPPGARRFALRLGIDYRRVQVFEPLGQTRVSTVFVYRFVDRPADARRGARRHGVAAGSRRLR